MMEDMELLCFKIISSVGEAKSDYITAIELAKKGEFEKAQEMIAHGEECFVNGHRQHADLIAQEADGNSVHVSLLLMHAEDQLMAAETTKLLAQEIISLYQKLQ